GTDTVLSGVAAAVVGGVSLFGGRGRLMHAAIGALVIAVIANGLGLLNLPAGMNYIVTGGVLVLAATVDAVSRVRAGGAVRRTSPPPGSTRRGWPRRACHLGRGRAAGGAFVRSAVAFGGAHVLGERTDERVGRRLLADVGGPPGHSARDEERR